jgi:hypothetical protein
MGEAPIRNALDGDAQVRFVGTRADRVAASLLFTIDMGAHAQMLSRLELEQVL